MWNVVTLLAAAAAVEAEKSTENMALRRRPFFYKEPFESERKRDEFEDGGSQAKTEER